MNRNIKSTLSTVKMVLFSQNTLMLAPFIVSEEIQSRSLFYIQLLTQRDSDEDSKSLWDLMLGSEIIDIDRL